MPYVFFNKFLDSGLRERLNRITSSEYFVMTPEIKILSQQAASVVAPDVSLYVPNVLLNQSSTEDEVLQMEGESNYFQYQVCLFPLAETLFCVNLLFF